MVLHNGFFALKRFTKRALAFGLGMGAIAGVLLVPAHAEQCIVLEDFSSSAPNSFPAGWKPREEPGKNSYLVIKEGEISFVRAKAAGPRSAGNGIEADRPVKWNIEEYPILRWQWRPRVFPQGANEDAGKDDSVLGVYVGFCPPEDLGLCERSLKGQLSLADRIALPKLFFKQGVGSLKYIWSESLAKGFEFDKGRKAVKVLENGMPATRAQWVKEQIDIASDYRRRFGTQKLLNPIGLSILTDADDTRSWAEGDYADFKLCRE